MTDVLGYEKYGSLGSDYGALVNSVLGHKYNDSVIALHYGHDLPPGMFQHERFWDLTAGEPIPADASPQLRADILKLHATYASHVTTVEGRIAAFENGPTRDMFNAVNVNAHHRAATSGTTKTPGPTSVTSARHSARCADLTKRAATDT
ncbi:hypothetical protein [Streptomyces sp. NPDC050538]|uniref:hypothetical protein n=1 Tax=Streptomyces sp. NPDC050538 TaxID=3365627 RepID=UPI00379F8B06